MEVNEVAFRSLTLSAFVIRNMLGPLSKRKKEGFITFMSEICKFCYVLTSFKDIKIMQIFASPFDLVFQEKIQACVGIADSERQRSAIVQQKRNRIRIGLF
jgi:hypothetical protein